MAGWQDAPIATAAGIDAGAAPAWQAAPIAAGPTNQQKYEESLANVRRNEFPNMTDEQFANYSKAALAPYSLTDQAQQAQTMGFGDEIGAGIGAFGNQVRQWTGGGGPGFGQAYDDLVKLEQARRDVGAEHNGIAGNVASVIGGISSLGPEKAALDATIAAGRTGVPAVAAALTAIKAPLWQQAAKTAVTAAPIGAVAGFGSADGGLPERLSGAGWGASTAAATGLVTPYVVSSVGGAFKNVADAMLKRRASAVAGLDPSVADFLQKTMGADGSFGSAGQARIAAAGPEAMNADAGPAARAALDTAIQSNGEAGQLAREKIGERVSRDAQALQDSMDLAMGRPQGLNEMRQNIASASAPARSDAYHAAYAQPIDYSSPEGMHLEDMLSNRVDHGTITAANTLMRRNGEASQQIIAHVADDGSVTYAKQPDVRQIDYITRALNDKAEQNAGLGKLGGQTAEGASYQNLSRDLRSTLRAHVPEYGTALDTAADPIQRSQAVKFGYSVLDPGTTRDDVAMHVHNISPGARQATAQGIRANLDDALANVTRTVQDGDVPAREGIAALRKLSSRAAKEKLAMVIGEGPADEMLTEFNRAANSFELRAAVADNSKTFARQQQNEAVKKFSEGGANPFQELAKGSPLEAGKRAVQFATGETVSNQAARSEAFQRQIAEALLAQGNHATQIRQTLSGLNTRSASVDRVAKAMLSGGTNAGKAASNTAWLWADHRRRASAANP